MDGLPSSKVSIRGLARAILQEVSIVGAFVAIVGFVLVSTSLFSSKLCYIPFHSCYSQKS